MISGTGRANARRRRDVQLPRNLFTTLWILLLLLCPIITTIFSSHPLLLPSFEEIEFSERVRWCLPASYHHLSPRVSHRESKPAKVEACASICSYLSNSEICLTKLYRSVKSISFPVYLRRNLANPVATNPLSAPEPALTIHRSYNSLPYLLACTSQLSTTTTQTPIFFSSPSSRRTLKATPSIEKFLGFPLMGPYLFGPLILLPRPIYGFRGPPLLFDWIRFALPNSLLSPLKNRSRYFTWNGRRQLPSFASTPLQWLSDYHVRTMIQSQLYTVCKLSPEEFTHRISLMARDNLGPLLASCPGSMSRTHGNSFFWVIVSFSEKFSRLSSNPSAFKPNQPASSLSGIILQPSRTLLKKPPRSSSNFFDFKLNHPATSILGEASQLSRTFPKKPPRYFQPNSFSSLLKSMFRGRELIGRGNQSSLASFLWLWSCEYLWRVRQTFSGILNLFLTASSFLEQFIKSSYASIARAVYDHKLVREFSKLVFKYESLRVSK
ncbi:unnamed protein product [Arabidopsis halleri]